MTATNATNATTYTAHPDVMHTDLGSEVILVHGATGHSYRLNASARLAWLQLPTTAPALGAALAAQFAVDTATALQDAQATLQDMADKGLALRG